MVCITGKLKSLQPLQRIKRLLQGGAWWDSAAQIEQVFPPVQPDWDPNTD